MSVKLRSGLVDDRIASLNRATSVFSCLTIGLVLESGVSKMVSSLDLSPSAHLKVTLLVETLTPGQVVASILEFPHCRVEAETREVAIAQLQATFLERLQHIEAISWDVPIQASEPDWMKFAGVFQDDRDFQEIMEAIRAERASDDDSEVDPSYYL